MLLTLLISIALFVFVFYFYKNRLKSVSFVETFLDTTTTFLRTNHLSPFKNSSINATKYNQINVHDDISCKKNLNVKNKVSLRDPSKANANVHFASFDTTSNNAYVGDKNVNVMFKKRVSFDDDVKTESQVLFNKDVNFEGNTLIDSTVTNMDHKNLFCFQDDNPMNCITYSDISDIKDKSISDIDSLYFQTAGACLPSASLIQKNFNDTDNVNFTSLQDDMKCMYPTPGKAKLLAWYEQSIA